MAEMVRRKDFLKHRRKEVNRKEASNLDKIAYSVDENFTDFVNGCSQKIAKAVKR